MGPRSGRMAGFCVGFGRFCRTIGRWPGGAYQGLEAGVEAKMLADRIRYMEQNLDLAKKRLDELQKGPNQTG
jgi:hypothetical protein